MQYALARTRCHRGADATHCDQLVRRRRTSQPACGPHLRIVTSPPHRRHASRPAHAQPSSRTTTARATPSCITVSLSDAVIHRDQLVHRTRASRPASPSPSSRTAASPRIAVAHCDQPTYRRHASWPARAPPLCIATSLSIAVAHRGLPANGHDARGRLAHSHPGKAGSELHEAEMPASSGNHTGKAAHAPAPVGHARPQGATPYPA